MRDRDEALGQLGRWWSGLSAVRGGRRLRGRRWLFYARDLRMRDRDEALGQIDRRRWSGLSAVVGVERAAVVARHDALLVVGRRRRARRAVVRRRRQRRHLRRLLLLVVALLLVVLLLRALLVLGLRVARAARVGVDLLDGGAVPHCAN